MENAISNVRNGAIAMDTSESPTVGLLIILAKRKKFILVSTILFGAVAAIATLLLRNQYTATTVLLPPQGSSAGSALLSQLSSMGPMASATGYKLGIKNPNDMYVALLKIQPVEDTMVNRFDLKSEYRSKKQSEARKAFENRCDIQSGSKDGLIRISVTDRNPKRAEEMANAYVDEFRKFSRTVAITEASQRRLFFEQQLVQTKTSLDNAEEALKKTEQTAGLVQLGGQAMALVESAASLHAQIAAKEVEIRAMRSYAGDKNSGLLMAEQQLEGWQAELSSLTGNQSDSGDDVLLSRGQVSEAGLEYARKVRDVKYYETIFDLLAKQFEMAKLDEAKEGSTIQVIAPATVPDIKSDPPRMLITLVATIAGFLFACLYTLYADRIRVIRQIPEQRAQLDELTRLVLGRGFWS